MRENTLTRTLVAGAMALGMSSVAGCQLPQHEQESNYHLSAIVACDAINWREKENSEVDLDTVTVDLRQADKEHFISDTPLAEIGPDLSHVDLSYLEQSEQSLETTEDMKAAAESTLDPEQLETREKFEDGESPVAPAFGYGQFTGNKEQAKSSVALNISVQDLDKPDLGAAKGLVEACQERQGQVLDLGK